jgi:hypothetical protein
MKRILPLLHIVLTLFLADHSAPAAEAESGRVELVKAGVARARLVIPGNASAPAALMAEGIRKSTGAQLAIAQEGQAAETAEVEIHVGATKYARGLGLSTEGLHEHGFVFAFPDARHVVLLSPSALGLEFAATEFLERYVGVRWLFPGALGEHVPRQESLAIPAVAVREQPAYYSRVLSGIGRDGTKEQAREQRDWARRLRMSGEMQFHHNLFQLIPPKVYGETHPEFFPVQNGKRRVIHARLGWQPCFSAPGLAEEAAQRISDYFAKPPRNKTSYSLGVNDGAGYCECEACRAQHTRLEGANQPVRHEEYFVWCNRVIHLVRQQHAEKHFGFLAYSSTSHPPLQTKLDDHLVPYLTYDRMKWAAPDLAKQDQQLTRDWAQAAPALGCYDYVFGKQYPVPRVYFHEMGRYLRFGHENHMRFYYAEAYPGANWHEGPKLYVLLKLLWNPQADVDALLDDWYRAAAGEKAAPHLRDYFGLWEKFWTQTVPSTPWFDVGAMFLHYTDSSYLKAFDMNHLAQADELLRRAHAAAPEGPQRQRVEFMQAGFREWSLAVRTYGDFQPLPLAGAPPEIIAEVSEPRLAAGLAGWDTWQRASSKARFTWDEKTGHIAPGSLRCDTADSNGTPLLFQTNVPIQPGKNYHVRVVCRVEKLLPADASEIQLVVKWKNRAGKFATYAPAFTAAPAQPPGTGWQPIELRFKTALEFSGDVTLAVPQITVRNAKSGTVWFDDFSFAEIAP